MKSVSFERMSEELGFETGGAGNTAVVTGITSDSRRVSAGDVFVAIKGAASDGHTHAPEAVSKGAVAVIGQRRIDGLSVPCAVTGNSKEAAARAAAFFYGRPSSAFTLAGVTGTNGKTTVCHLLKAIWERAGVCGNIGTVEIDCGSLRRDAEMTTPGAADLQELFSLMRGEGAERVCMEVSSHAISEKRADACDFDAAVFTNLTPEHLDYHKNIGQYADTKKKLFTELLAASGKKNKFSVVNIDDPVGVEIARVAAGEVVTYSSEDASADVFAQQVSASAPGMAVSIRAPWGNAEVNSNLMGGHNLSNILAATAAALCLGSAPDEVSAALSAPVFVPGRMERIGGLSAAIDVFVDYAHTADALDRVIRAARPLCRGKMFVVFGCGGDRDRDKRPEMGRVASENSDVVVLTSDNPRSEDPVEILSDIEAGTARGKCTVLKIADRKEAIRHAVMSATAGDFVLIAGKGHETYQAVMGENLPFDDRVIAADFLKLRGDAD